jgi:hypothetical protein
LRPFLDDFGGFREKTREMTMLSFLKGSKQCRNTDFRRNFGRKPFYAHFEGYESFRTCLLLLFRVKSEKSGFFAKKRVCFSRVFEHPRGEEFVFFSEIFEKLCRENPLFGGKNLHRIPEKPRFPKKAPPNNTSIKGPPPVGFFRKSATESQPATPAGSGENLLTARARTDGRSDRPLGRLAQARERSFLFFTIALTIEVPYYGTVRIYTTWRYPFSFLC